jgi:hypothetical protein
MLFDQQLIAYFTKGRIQPHATVIEIVSRLVPRDGALNGPKMDEVIRKEFAPDFAAKLIGKDLHERVDDDPTDWNETDGPHIVDPGFFAFATEVDWDTGTLSADWIPTPRNGWEVFFPSDDLLGSNIQNADFEVHLDGISFEFRSIEMLLPSSHINAPAALLDDRVTVRRSTGRPRKWDWEGALAFMVSQAQTPDGLPTGEGAQARIEDSIAEWFIHTVGDAPAASQIRERASSIMQMVGKPKKLERP